MMTRVGRSARTVSSVRPKSDPAGRRVGADITIARARIARASSTMRRPASPGLTFSQWPVTRLPPITRAESIVDEAIASSSGIAAPMGAVVGTVISTTTWIPRRRLAASLTAVDTASGE